MKKARYPGRILGFRHYGNRVIVSEQIMVVRTVCNLGSVSFVGDFMDWF